MSEENCECGNRLKAKITRDDPAGAYLYCQNKVCALFDQKQIRSGVDPDDPIVIYDERD